LKIQQLKFFVAVYEEGSFSAGAARVNATQSGLSMHVRQLETRYDVVLLNRSSSGVTPTEAGRRFYDAAIKVLGAAAHAEDTLKQLSGVLSDHIHVGLMPAFTRAVLTPALMRFSREHPNVRLSVQEAYTASLANDVSEGNLDFAVVPRYDTDPSLEFVSMGTDRECLVTSVNSPFQVGRHARLADLPPLRLVLPSVENARRPRIDRYLAENGILPEDILELDAMLGTLDLVANSGWVSILPGILCRPDLDGRKRLFTPLGEPPLPVDYMRINHISRPLSRAAQAFADVLQEELNTTLEQEPYSAR
jgi:LysR family transcriptional regulator, nitrogen assimilation regulatory protein